MSYIIGGLSGNIFSSSTEESKYLKNSEIIKSLNFTYKVSSLSISKVGKEQALPFAVK